MIKESVSQKESAIEVRMFGQGGEQGKSRDAFALKPIEQGEEVSIFPKAKDPITARATRKASNPVTELKVPLKILPINSQGNIVEEKIIEIKDKERTVKRLVTLQPREAVTIHPLTSWGPDWNKFAQIPDIPPSSLTHRLMTRDELHQRAYELGLTDEPPSQPEPQGSPPPPDAEYPGS